MCVGDRVGCLPLECLVDVVPDEGTPEVPLVLDVVPLEHWLDRGLTGAVLHGHRCLPLLKLAEFFSLQAGHSEKRHCLFLQNARTDLLSRTNIHACTCARLCACARTHTHTRTHTHARTRTHMHTHTRTQTHT